MKRGHVVLLSVFWGALLGASLVGCNPPEEEVKLPRGEAIGDLPEGSLMMFIDNENGVYCYSYLASISCVRM